MLREAFSNASRGATAMSTLQIPCPKCSTVLKLRDPNLLGKIGKCPKCSHRFVLKEPEEVQLELADAAPPVPLVGQAAQWVPDGAAPAPTAGGIAVAAVDPAAARVRQVRKRRKKGNVLAVLGMLGGIAAAAGLFAYALMPRATPKLAEEKPQQRENARPAATKPPAEEVAATHQKDPKAEPIQMQYVPMGARIVINVRPAELLAAGNLGEGEFLACTGPIGKWITDSLQAICREEPAKIEETLICLFLGKRGDPPEVSVVVHLKEAAKKSDLLDRLGGERMEASGRPYYVDATANQAYLLIDTKTYAICPRDMAEDMMVAFDTASTPGDLGMEELMAHTDRAKTLTVLCVPKDLQIHAEALFDAKAQDFFRNVIDWLSSDGEVEAVCWSLRLDHLLRSELLLRNSSVASVKQLKDRFISKLDLTPQELLDTVKQMNPKELGKRHVIGRVPAMSKAFALSTGIHTDNRLVALSTELPGKAAPNLALGTLLAWDESTRTNFGAGPSGGGGEEEDVSKQTIAQRFKAKIDVDFRRAPLFEAFEYIANEAKFKLTIDGDGLKLSGYTKNMPQTFKKDGAPAAECLQEILKAYGEMCLVVDEKAKLVTVTTAKVATDKGLTPYKF